MALQDHGHRPGIFRHRLHRKKIEEGLAAERRPALLRRQRREAFAHAFWDACFAIICLAATLLAVYGIYYFMLGIVSFVGRLR